jgi:predicted AlkP superfamily pyrophosphatase or phosphodiesterase
MKRILLLIALLALPAAAVAQEAAQRPAEADRLIHHVILISVDGLKPESYTRPDEHGLEVPTLREMVRNGAWSEGAEGVFPTVTYPSHTSMVTGVRPGTHGIVTNQPDDPLHRLEGMLRWFTEDIRVPTLWDAAHRAGLRTGIIYWPVTLGAQATAIVPEFWRSDDGSAEDQKLSRALSTPGLLDTVAKRFPTFYDTFRPPRASDTSLADVAVHLIETLRPHLLLLHMFDVDHNQHRYGPFSPQGNAAVENADRQIARVLEAVKRAGLWERTAVLVVSDHGFSPLTERMRPGVLLREGGLVTVNDRNRVTESRAWVIAGGGYAYIYLNDPNDAEAQQAVLEIFQPLAGRPGSGIARLFTADEVRAMGGDPRAFLALEAADGFGLAQGYTGDLIFPSANAAQHGLPPDRPEMRTSLLIYGPMIGQGKMEGARLIDVAPTIARWLGLKFDHAEGRPLDVPLGAAQAQPVGK